MTARMGLRASKIPQPGSKVKVMLEGFKGLPGHITRADSSGLTYSVRVPDASMPDGTRTLELQASEFEMILPVYQEVEPALDLSYTLPEPITEPWEAAYPRFWDRIKAGTYAGREWPDVRNAWGHNRYNQATTDAVREAKRKHRQELDDLFKRDIKTAYGFVGELDGFGNNLISYLIDYDSEGDYGVEQNLMRNMIQWLKGFNELVGILNGYRVVLGE